MVELIISVENKKSMARKVEKMAIPDKKTSNKLLYLLSL